MIVGFDRPLDHALLQRSLRVVNADHRPVPGHTAIGAGELSWRFTPQSAWEAQPYLLVVEGKLEDLAGNSLVRVFDRDLMRSEDDPKDVDRVALEFVGG